LRSHSIISFLFGNQSREIDERNRRFQNKRVKEETRNKKKNNFKKKKRI